MNSLVSEPKNDRFDGVYIGSKENEFIMPPNEFDLSGLAEFMRETNKRFDQLTEKEIMNFKY